MSDSTSVVTDSTLAISNDQFGQTVSSSSDTSSSSNVPLLFLTETQEEREKNATSLQLLPKLPSHSFKFSVWHDLSYTEIHGNQLKAPRVRAGPPVKEKMFYKLRAENDKKIHHGRRGKEKMEYSNQMENWENTEFCNLSYQDLQHAYQKENFLRILKRLFRVVELNVIDDGLRDLHTVTFPRCTHLNLSNNYLNSFKKLPRIPEIKVLIASDNNIGDLEGLDLLKKTDIEYLYLKGNPVVFIETYRRKVFKILPRLKVLDDIPKHEDDKLEPENNYKQPSSCVVS